MRYSLLRPDRKTLLFLPGLGDSSLSYLPFLSSPTLEQFNIVVPDWLGCGNTRSSDNNYSFHIQVEVLIKQIHDLENQIGFSLNNIVLVSHSMASIHAMLLCESMLKNKIIAVVSVEGTITQYGSFVSQKVFEVNQSGDFDQWFETFKKETILQEFVKKFPLCHSYYASLENCQPQAFLQNALEMHQVCVSGRGKYTNLAGMQFVELKLPKLYCYGDKSLCKESVDFLAEYQLPVRVFHTDCHFVMLTCFDEFVECLVEFVSQCS